MGHGIVTVFAYQEALLIEAVFGVAILTMIWVGFRRWLQHQDRASRLMADQAAQYGAQMERVEARLKGIEQVLTDSGLRASEQIEAGRPSPLPEPALKPSEE